MADENNNDTLERPDFIRQHIERMPSYTPYMKPDDVQALRGTAGLEARGFVKSPTSLRAEPTGSFSDRVDKSSGKIER